MTPKEYLEKYTMKELIQRMMRANKRRCNCGCLKKFFEIAYKVEDDRINK